MDPYQKKYLKYKSKYLLMQSELEQEGGAFPLNEIKEEDYDIYPIVEPTEPMKKKAAIEGKKLLDAWLGDRGKNGINTVLSKFYPSGKFIPNMSATAFSDYYKWTMMPVIWHLHTFITEKTSKKTFRVTFGIDIRDKTMRDAINADSNLREAIKVALKNLAERKFKKEIFDNMGEEGGLLRNAVENKPLLPVDCIDYICGKENPRTLANNNIKTVKSVIVDVKDEDVHIYFYKDAKAKYSPSDADEGLWFIEARGPWPRVTWLETSLMQAVYEAYLRYNLAKLGKGTGMNPEKAYEKWLYGSLLRCAKSVAFTRLVQKLPGKLMTPALFTGRRTGGYIFLLLQNLFFAHHFNQFTSPPLPKSPSESDSSYQTKIEAWKTETYTGGKTSCLGTSSVDCYFELTKLPITDKENYPINCLKPVGTHAHELSMVISVLFPYFDKNKFFLPLTQIIGHELYRTLSAIPRPTPTGMVIFPMLPDTLGTAAFMKAANWVKVPKPDAPSGKGSFISLINSARQDSGKLPNFLTLMDQWNYKGGKMASEIDDTETLYKATDLGYINAGAGGFYGDSVKVWNPDKQYHPPSMAVKAVNVEFCVPENEKQFYEELHFPHITIINKADKSGHVKGYPIKVGDPDDMAKPALAEGKLSLDKTLPAETIEAIKSWVSARRVRAFKSNDNDKINSDNLDISLFTGENLTPKPANFRGKCRFI